MTKEGKFLTSKQAADKLGFCPDYIRKLCADGTIKAEQYGKTWVIDSKELRKIHRQRQRRETNDADGSEE